MITEIAQIELTPGMEDALMAGVTEAKAVFGRAKGCQGMSLTRSVEKPGRFRLMVLWATLEDHTVAFRGSPDFQIWRELVSHCFASPPEVEHVAMAVGPFTY